MRRLIVFFFVIVLLFSMVVTSFASYSSNDDLFIDVLALQESTSFQWWAGPSFDVDFDIPSCSIRYFEGLFTCRSNDGNLPQVSFYGTPFTVQQIDSQTYRFYGFYYYIGSNPKLTFSNIYPNYPLNLLDYKVSINISSPLSGSVNSSYGSVFSQYLNFVDSGNFSYTYTGSDSFTRSGQCFNYIRINECSKYDFVNLNFGIQIDSLDSIAIYKDGRDGETLPFTTNFISGNHDHILWNFVNLSIDLRNITRDFDQIYIEISGRFNITFSTSNNMTYNYLSIYNCVGHLEDNYDPYLPWYKKIWNSMKDGFYNVVDRLDAWLSGTDQQNTNAENFNTEVDNQANELEDLTADLNSVTRPPLSDVNLSTSGMVDQSVVILATNGIGSILSNQIILRVLIMSLTFALAGFILFGKR